MRVACYSVPGPARDVIRIVERPKPVPAPNEVLVRVHVRHQSSDVKSRKTGPLAFAEIIPHSDGAGVIEAVGSDVDSRRSANASGYGIPPGNVLTAPRLNTSHCRRGRPFACRTTPHSRWALV